MVFVEPVTLRGEHVTLEPLSREHRGELAEAVSDGELWKLWYTFIPHASKMPEEVERRLNWQGMVPFTVRRNDTGKACGMTTFMNIDAVHRRVEIGGTWYAKSVQRSAVNTECKYLLLSHAFEKLNCIAVEFRTHWMNQASRAAIARLGAKQDGVLRNHMVMPDGTKRDTVVFSIIDSEWPTIKRHLQHKLGR